MDKETFDRMWEMSAPGSDSEQCFMRLPQTEYYLETKPKPHELEHMPNFRYLESTEYVEGTVYGIHFTTLTIDTPVYLMYLLSRVQALGGAVVRGSVHHISQVAEGWARVLSNKEPKPPAVVVVCTGIGSRFLGGVEDKNMYPIRGQTVLLRAPWVRFGRTISGSNGSWTYIIPRQNGDVMILHISLENSILKQAFRSSWVVSNSQTIGGRCHVPRQHLTYLSVH
jgi:D-aspartate oxidase